MSQKMLFISFTGLIYGLKYGKVSQADLDEGLFAFGCTKGHVLNPGKKGEGNELEHACDTPEEAAKLHEIIVAAVKKAEKEHRATFRNLHEGNMSWKRINDLLKRNGFKKIVSTPEYPLDRWSYNYPTVEELVKSQNIGIQVFWR